MEVEEAMSKVKYEDDLSQIECPYCAEAVDLSDEPAYYTDGEDNPAVCGECNKEFYVTGHADWSWTTHETEL